MSDQQSQSNALQCSLVSPLLPLAVTGERPSEIGYIDPHLIVLLFLLGFCFVYLFILIADRFLRSGASPPQETAWLPKK